MAEATETRVVASLADVSDPRAAMSMVVVHSPEAIQVIAL